MSRSEQGLHVLVVDDSAVVRRFMSSVLSQERDTTVATAADPIFAMQRIADRRPDVILLDIEMPRMNGLTFLRKIMAEDPIPVVICSGFAGRGSRVALDALSHGAVEIVSKPDHGVQEFLQESAVMLFDVVRAAAQARVSRRPQRAAKLTSQARSRASERPNAPLELIALGASTGGPEALQTVLTALPREMPPIVVVQHMPKSFTSAFAERLDRLAALEIREASEGDRLVPGRVLIAPGNRHLVVVRRGSGRIVRLVDGPLVSRHRPSVDVLFRSVARSTGAAALGAILTGMGDDGVQGLLEMKAAGAATMAQDEASSVVFGMPKQALERGAATHTVALAELAPLLSELAAPSDSLAAGGAH